MMLSERAIQLPRGTVDPLRPCPFCGAAPVLEPDPWTGQSVRIACGSGACGIRPATEYLLPDYADELCRAWNGRVPAEGPTERHHG